MSKVRVRLAARMPSCEDTKPLTWGSLVAFIRGQVQLWGSTEPRGTGYLGPVMGIREVWGQGARQIVVFCLPLFSCICTLLHLFSPRLCYYFPSFLVSRWVRSNLSWPRFTFLTRGHSHCPGSSLPYHCNQGPSGCEHSNPLL